MPGWVYLYGLAHPETRAFYYLGHSTDPGARHKQNNTMIYFTRKWIAYGLWTLSWWILPDKEKAIQIYESRAG